ncbi:MAG: UDP-N-acetylmuramyl peptide synthase [Sulfobacillus acidophilus]|uniref:UDP-N-acetylmuramyl peptide synthase n=1 Tax=Sulfobacillus acidophilus TaxID=53633 RepID=A0A2T2WFU0_9FIRM|nr:MAG: UDP-N-acetylmuramyl peptide synthase [Sulfobacillus acidophilus]
MSCTLSELFFGLCDHNLRHADLGVIVDNIVVDSRRVQPHDLFVALPGQHADGFAYIPHALNQGAAAVLAARAPTAAIRKTYPKVPWITCSDPRTLLSELSARLYHYPARAVTLHAVTGTNGKTSTVYMLAHILRHQGLATAFWTTNQVEGIQTPFRPQMTTPDPPDLHRFLREAGERGARHIIIEVSSHALQLRKIAGLTFQTAAFTNITPDHLDFHGSFESYVQAKASLLQYVSSKGGLALNHDDDQIRAFAATATAPVTFFGMDRDADLQAHVDSWGVDYTQWQLLYRRRPVARIRMTVPGSHNVLNALAAIAMAMHLGCDAAAAAHSLQDFVLPPRRLETIQAGRYTIMSDVAMNRGSYDAVMRAVAAVHKPLVVVTALRGNRGALVNRDIAYALADWNQALHFEPVLATLSDANLMRLPVDYRVRSEEQQAFMDAAHERNLSVRLFSELSQALDAAIARLQSGSVLLLLGTFGMDDGLEIARDRLSQRPH